MEHVENVNFCCFFLSHPSSPKSYYTNPVINFLYCISGSPAGKKKRWLQLYTSRLLSLLQTNQNIAIFKFFLSLIIIPRFLSKHSDGRDPPGSPNRRAAASTKESTAQWLARQAYRPAARLQHITTTLTWPTAGCDVIKGHPLSPVGGD